MTYTQFYKFYVLEANYAAIKPFHNIFDLKGTAEPLASRCDFQRLQDIDAYNRLNREISTFSMRMFRGFLWYLS